MTPQKGNRHRDTLRGAYRIHELVAYQKTEKEGEEDKSIGTSEPLSKESKTTIFKVDGLRAKKSPKDREEKPVYLKGTGILKLIKFGEVEGDFTDSDGFKWTMKCSRVRE